MALEYIARNIAKKKSIKKHKKREKNCGFLDLLGGDSQSKRGRVIRWIGLLAA